ncbi:MAG: hypothetical protein ACMZ7B_13735 [Balneola sp.]
MKKIFIPFLLILFLSTTNCLNNVEDNTGSDQADVSFAADIQPIMQNSCNNCHSAGQSGFNSSSYAAIMASVSPSNRYNGTYVIAGNADASPLTDKLSINPQFGSRMPLGSSLSGDDIEKIRAWINEGALNN